MPKSAVALLYYGLNKHQLTAVFKMKQIRYSSLFTTYCTSVIILTEFIYELLFTSQRSAVFKKKPIYFFQIK